MKFTSKVETAAVPFELKGLDGGIHRLESHAGTWQLLVFHRHLA